jgi:hypothetical protein
LLWVPGAAISLALQLRGEARGRLLGLLGAVAGTLALVYAHGALRPAALLKETLLPIHVTTHETPAEEYGFQPFRELIVVIRFISWAWAGIIVHFWQHRVKNGQASVLPKSAFLAALFVATASVWAAEVIPGVADLLGRIYQYDPHHPTWADRAYGVFRSPVEGGAVLGFSVLLLVYLRGWIKPAPWAFLVLGATFMTRSITSIVAMVLSGALILLRERRILLGAGALLGGALAFWALRETPFIASKIANFLYRIKPWVAYWNIGVSRWDFFLLGTGFNSFYVDNIYVFLFNRGGAVLLAGFLGLLLLFARSRWSDWTPVQRVIFLLPLVSGIATDSFVIRPFAAVFFCLAVPALSTRPRG